MSDKTVFVRRAIVSESVRRGASRKPTIVTLRVDLVDRGTPIAAGSLVVGAVAGFIFVKMFTLTQNRWKIDDVLGVWPLHGLCGAWGGIAAGIFGLQALGGLGGVSFMAQLIGTALGVTIALAGGFLVYGGIKKAVGIRLDAEEEFNGADLSIHKISATPEREAGW